jgi:hypothetical protein
MSFFSLFALDPRNRNAVVFSHLVVESDGEGSNLFLVEKKLDQADAIIDVNSVDDTHRVTLITGLSSIRFQYLHHLGVDGNRDWKTDWDPDDNTGIPLAVRIQIVDQAFGAPITVLVPLRSRGAA